MAWSRAIAWLGIALWLCAVPGGAVADPALPTLVALSEAGALLVFEADHPEAAKAIQVHELGGALVGIDLRPADQRIYGLSTTNEIYRVDPSNGEVELVSSLTVPFDGGARSGVDFNPQSDRLRLVGAEGQNLRVNVEIGATAVDRSATYAAGDANAGRRPGIAASAYTNSRAGAATTKLFNIDAVRGVLVLQDPPNDGTQVTVGPLGAPFGALAGFEIVTDSSGQDRGYAAAGRVLYAIDLATGAATALGPIGGAGSEIISLTSAGTR
ncbi:MAG TPA: DUF4394 domain-containing protein [Myxococcota bacterium]|nr:DUF4394 domain-containing protein [Myxococcota bacterium]